MLPGVVMKFGGTSLATPAAMERAVAHILAEPRSPLVVASAVGGVTDLLLQAAAAALEGQEEEARRMAEQIRDRHLAISEGLHLAHDLLDDLEDQLGRLLQGIALLRERTLRVQDLLLSLGERMSVRLLAAALQRAGRDARHRTGGELGLLTSAAHGRAEPTASALAAMRRALQRLEPGPVPVVTGFIGQTESGDITTLGRGGSDFSAALLGAAAGVEEIQIWTDVPGISRADPRIVPEAATIEAMSFEEAAELAYFGAKVLHPRTIEPARQAKIPVRVLGTFHVDPGGKVPASQQGTRIDDRAPAEPVRALALRQGVESLHIHSLRMLEAPGFLARVFDILARHSISVDVIATSEVSISMTFDRCEGDLAGAVQQISALAEVELITSRSILCLVGSGLRRDTGLLARIFDILARHQVPVHVISQGASRINITVVIDPPHCQTAMRALHRSLFGGG